MSHSGSEMVSAAYVAKLTGLHKSTVRRNFPNVKVGRRVLIRREYVETVLRGQSSAKDVVQ